MPLARQPQSENFCPPAATLAPILYYFCKLEVSSNSKIGSRLRPGAKILCCELEPFRFAGLFLVKAGASASLGWGVNVRTGLAASAVSFASVCAVCSVTAFATAISVSAVRTSASKGAFSFSVRKIPEISAGVTASAALGEIAVLCINVHVRNP